MFEWWSAMTVIEQVFACIAIPATIILIIQSVMLLFGLGFENVDVADMDADASLDFHGDVHSGDAQDSGDDGDSNNENSGLSLFTIRGLVAFFAVGGWTGLVLSKYIDGVWAGLLAFAAGAVALVAVALLFKYSFKLQDKGNLDINNALGKTGKVYIPVPACQRGQGKITIMLQERLVELDAVTKAAQQLSTGAVVRVSGIIDDQTVAVMPLDEQTNNSRGGISQWIQP